MHDIDCHACADAEGPHAALSLQISQAHRSAPVLLMPGWAPQQRAQARQPTRGALLPSFARASSVQRPVQPAAGLPRQPMSRRQVSPFHRQHLLTPEKGVASTSLHASARMPMCYQLLKPASCHASELHAPYQRDEGLQK